MTSAPVARIAQRVGARPPTQAQRHHETVAVQDRAVDGDHVDGTVDERGPAIEIGRAHV
jgi:hypothetical protein